ncbi:MAG: sulfite exporter TauE/SafE family protein [Candidatus Methanomethylicia archaeon]
MIGIVLFGFGIFIVGIVSAMIGVGGGFLMVPIFNLILGFTAHRAVGTSSFAIFFTALSASIAYLRQGRVDKIVGIVLAITSIVGASLGAYTTKLFSSIVLTSLFGLFLVFISLYMILTANREFRSRVRGSLKRIIMDRDGEKFEYHVSVGFSLIVGFLAGFISGFFGVGGGIIVVSLMVILMGLPIHIAVATSMFTMMFTSTSSLLTHLTIGNVDLTYGVTAGFFIALGAQLGAYIAKRIKPKQLKRAFGIFLIFIGLRMVLQPIISIM